MDEHGTLSAEEERRAFGEPEPDVIEAPRASPLDMRGANGTLFAALAKAQAAVESVGKDGKNRDKGYNYATADSMVRGGRAARALAGAELALITAWTFVLCDPPRDTSSGQWPGALVTLWFTLGHAGGGFITGSVEGHAICSRGRPIDKAVTAAATYLEGFAERGLMRLDRAEEGADDVERRQETDTAPAQRQQRQTQAAVVSAPVVSLVALLDKVTTEEALALAKENARGKFRGMNPAEKQATTAAIVRAEERVKPPVTKRIADATMPPSNGAAQRNPAEDGLTNNPGDISDGDAGGPVL